MEQYYFGSINDDNPEEYVARKPSNISDFEDMSAHVLMSIRALPNRLEKLIINNVAKHSPEHKNYFKSLQMVFNTESHLDQVASNKLVVTPKIAGFGISLYYQFKEGRGIYEFHKARITDPSVAHLKSSELDITEKFKGILDMLGTGVVPSYIHRVKLEDLGVGLDADSATPPKFLSVKVVMTIPALELLGHEYKLSQLLRGWLNEPREAVKEALPKPHFVAYDLSASSGYLSEKELVLKGTAGANRKFFNLNRRSIIDALTAVGFTSVIQNVDSVGLVRGLVMGISSVCFDTYIVPALHSIKETNRRYGALKKEKDMAEFKKHTLRKLEDKQNILNYMRSVPYIVEGLIIEPNYIITKRELAQENIPVKIYLTPKVVDKLPDSSVMEVMKVANVGYDEAKTIVEVAGYDGTKPPFTRAVIKDLKRIGIEISEKQRDNFHSAMERITRARNASNYSELIMGRERLWDIAL